ncbi:Bug family tripartite tricarboxylate transporter substrate binding protein [Achromobacter sp. NPDC058515]|uniref:Bug family tripartite tricarboxylate transporter substrate binding protein n=1 Tax=Achromobacter sp. NPDC058515 TaxID=3346533 RepID=UPI003669B7E1
MGLLAGRHHWSRAAASGLAALALCTSAGSAGAASDWPDRPVRMIVPFAAGGATDVIARALGQRLGTLWKQPVVVENRPGAGGMVGAEVVAKSAADGYTLLIASGSMFTVNPHIYSKLSYGAKDFSMITKVATGPMVVVVNPSVPAKNMAELIAYAKTRPKQLNFGSAGIGSQVHMAGEALADKAGIELVHVPYKGESLAYADLMAGHVQLVVGNIAGVTPLVASGKVRALAVTSEQRSPMLPDVPTSGESGMPGFEMVGWFALMAPAGVPPKLIGKMHSDIAQALADENTKAVLRAQGMNASVTTSAQLTEAISAESETWSKVVARRHLKAD